MTQPFKLLCGSRARRSNRRARLRSNRDTYGEKLERRDLLAGTVVLSPTDDAFVYLHEPNAPHGANHYFETTNLAHGIPMESFLKFDLSSVPGEIVDAKLELVMLYSSTVNATQAVERLETDAWSEGVVTWNNRPSGVADAIYFNLPTPTPGANVVVTIDVDSLVFPESTEHNAGDEVVSLRLYNPFDTEEVSVTLYGAKESPRPAEHPRLVIAYEDPAPVYAFNEAGEIYTLTPSEDTYVQADQSGANAHAALPQVLTSIVNDASYRESFLKFDLSAIDPALAAAEASLELTPIYLGTLGIQNSAATVPSNWSEHSLSWTNRPIESASFATWTVNEIF